MEQTATTIRPLSKSEDAPVILLDWTWYNRLRMWLEIRLITARIAVQRWIRRLIGVEREIELIAEYIHHHERLLDVQREDRTTDRTVDESRRRRYHQVLQERMDNLHAMQTARLRMLEKTVYELHMLGMTRGAKPRRK